MPLRGQAGSLLAEAGFAQKPVDLSLGSFLEGKHQPPFLDKVTYVDGLVAVLLAGSNLGGMEKSKTSGGKKKLKGQ
jgi:hypothetical protein